MAGSTALLTLCLVLAPGCSEANPTGSSGSGAADPLGLKNSARTDTRSEEELSAPELFIRAKEVAQAGDDERAVEMLRRVVEMEPGVADPRFTLGTLLVPMASAVVLGSSAKDYEILDEALLHLDQAVQLQPGNANYLYWYGRALDIRGREEDALVQLAKAVELDPEHAKAFKRIGLVHAERGSVEEALAAFQRAADLWPQDAGLQYQLGNLALDGDPERARDHYRAALELNPLLASAQHGLSQALAQLGDETGAEAARAMAERLQGQKETLDQIERQAENQPAKVEAQFQAAEANFVLQKLDRAQSLLTRVIQLQPDHAGAHYLMGLIRAGEEDWTMAMNHLEESIYFAPEKIGPRVELIRVAVELKNANRVEELATELEVMLDGGGIDVAEYNAVAEVFLEVGRTAKATEYLRAALAMEPGDEAAGILLERAKSEQ